MRRVLATAVVGTARWVQRRKRCKGARRAHTQWGPGWIAPVQLSFQSRLSLARSNRPLNTPLMEQAYNQLLAHCARPIPQTPWMWLPLDVHASTQILRAQSSVRHRKALDACVQWVSEGNLNSTANLLQ